MTKVMTVVGTRPEIIRLSEVIGRIGMPNHDMQPAPHWPDNGWYPATQETNGEGCVTWGVV